MQSSSLHVRYVNCFLDKKRLQKFINLQLIIGLIWLVICITILLTFREIIFKAYSIDFDHATFAIILSLVGSYLFSVTGISEMICLYNDMNKTLYPISFLQLISIGLLCYILIPQLYMVRILNEGN